MNKNERLIIAAVFALIFAFVGIDLLIDSREGTSILHFVIEGIIAFVAILSALFILIGVFVKKNKLEAELLIANSNNDANRAEAKLWRDKAKTFIDGLSSEISKKLDEWGLSASEKEIAFMLLKGLSLREIAKARGTNEKTTRAQATSIYQKSGLSGRADLSAFFLEDLLG